MNIHSSIDTITAAVGSAVIGDRKYFAESLDSQPIGDVIRQSHAEECTLAVLSQQDIPIQTPVGQLNMSYALRHWAGPDSPTILYHHGNNEDPFDTSRFATHSFKTIFHGHEDEFAANIIAVRAPFHTLSTKEFAERMGSLGNFTSMLAASVVGIGSLIQEIQHQWNSKILISGFSLGGWVTNLHRTYSKKEVLYVPLFAGASLGELFVDSAYRRMTSSTALEHDSLLRKVLNFEADFNATGRSEAVSALLGRYDQYIQLESQRECYESDQLTIIPKGHVTGSLAGDALRDHLLSAIDAL